MLPNFIVIGAAKCGTTSICDLLGHHPQIFMSDPKEPYYFCDKDYDSSERKAWYQSLFENADGKIAIGEGTTSYTHPDVCVKSAQRIYKDIPNCKIIYLVRNPLKRLESDWKMRNFEGWSPDSINEAVRTQPNLILHGKYWENLREYQRLFGSQQILVVFFEDFIESPDSVLEECFSFLNVDQKVRISDSSRPRNASSNYGIKNTLFLFLSESKFAPSLKNIFPRTFQDWIKKILTKKHEYKLSWNQELKNELIREYKSESKDFLRMNGKPENY